MMLRTTLVSLPLLLLSAASSPAQKNAAEAPAETGIVSGRVFCADTNLPARRALVGLILASDLEHVHAGDKEIAPSGTSASAQAETSLDGSFVLHAPAGVYYVITSKHGYVPAVASLNPATQTPLAAGDNSQEPAANPLASLQKIVVQAREASVVNLSIERGAAIGGTVRYDDGGPADGFLISLLVRSNNNWSEFNLTSFPDMDEAQNFYAVTDDQGHFRISGLPKGEYLLQASGGHGSLHQKSNDSLDVYSGDVTRKKDGVPVAVGAGEELRGEEIVIPLSKLRTVRGRLAAANDGHTLGEGRVSLLFADDKSVLAHAEIGVRDDGFSFPNVPEGDYILRVESAADNVETSDTDELVLTSQAATHARHRYSATQQPIHVAGDVTNLVVSVPDKAAKTLAKSGQQ